MRIAPTLLVALLMPLTAAALTPEGRMDVIHDLQQGRADAALQQLQPATTRSSRDADAAPLLCRLVLQLEPWDQALSACPKPVEFAGNSSDNHLWSGRALGEKAD